MAAFRDALVGPVLVLFLPTCDSPVQVPESSKPAQSVQSIEPTQSAQSPPSALPVQSARANESTGFNMVTTTVIYKLKDHSLSDIRAEGPSDALRQSCTRDLRQAFASGAHVGEAVGSDEWKFQCFDSFPK